MYCEKIIKENISYIRKLVNEYPDSYGRIITSKKQKDLLDFINYMTPLLQNNNYLLSTKCFWILNNIKDFPKCIYCGNPILRNVKINEGYGDFCSRSCVRKSEYSVQKVKETKLQRYNNPYYNNSDKNKKTCLERYGVTHPSKLKCVIDKIQKTNLERYGCKCTLSYDKFKEKRNITWLKKYGTINPKSTPEVQKAYEETCYKKYHVKNVSQLQSIKDKKISTSIKNFGCPLYIASKEGQEKLKEIFKLRYGVEHPAQNHEICKKSKSKYYYNNKYFDSSWELAMYIYLMDNKINFEYHPERIEYFVNNVKHYYMPDFCIEGILYEVKGDQFIDPINGWKSIYNKNDNEKEKMRYKCCIDNNVNILYYNDIKKYLSYITNKYGSNYLKKFKVCKI